MTCTKAPWWRIGLHAWDYSTDDEAREHLRPSQKDVWILGTLEAREYRTCQRCGRREQRDVYAGPFMPYDWTLRQYLKPASQTDTGDNNG